MILSLILAVSYLITNLELLQPKLKTDNFINPNDNTIENLNKEIAQLEQDSKATKTYTIQYKKRVDYNKNPTSSEALDYKDSIIEETFTPKEENKQEEKLQLIPYQNALRDSKPKIVIIIDDILNIKQLNDIKSIDLKLTPPIFPNNNINMINATNKLDFFMIHLPLEAKKYTDELDTIKIGDSIGRIRKKIQSIKSSMPSVKYINNHTGSKFTANKKSVETLLSVLDDNEIKFVDSRTTPDTKLNEIAKEQNRLILHRDIFIDNSLELNALNKQIAEGVKIAKKRGYAILIAHPHKETLHALKLAKDNIFKDVDVIYLNELDEILQNAKITQYTQKAS
ncbi:MAG: divergent polysaccharide deacetylase family protein [Helicobacteraceae bacterium]|nr:divergent polysaccharide deacetylase family protein [Helicobacteraceae bacterium]